MRHENIEKLRLQATAKIHPQKPMIMVGMGTCGIGNGANEVYNEFEKRISSANHNILLKITGCFGFCANEPLVTIYQPGLPLLLYHKVEVKDVQKLIDSVLNNKPYKNKILCQIAEWNHITSIQQYGNPIPGILLWNEISFFKGQKKIVLRDAGLINPEDIEEYIAIGGYHALIKTLTLMNPENVVAEVLDSRLRGRGGAGFPTGKKWEFLQKAEADQKYLICNADEGDPGAYMNRNEIESDPHMLIEGMIIGGYATGASKGILYVRAEYPLAVKRLKLAIKQAQELSLLGDNILGSGFSFDLDVVEGAGAFVCGEETALIASIEGKAGRPMPRPPFPANKGLWGKPTNINNVETWCNIPVILEKGHQWFLETGTPKSPGTKVFSLVGKVKNTGLVELPLGTTIEQMVFDIGEGTGTSKRVKAVQSGGPSGGCIPVEHFNTPVDYESLDSLGAIMGSGGMVVMDQDNCMVDVARYFIEFTSSESCGKCTPCREGLSQALHLLNKISRGEATEKDITTLELLSQTIKDTALCGLGQTAPNPIQTTLRFFRNEYEQHIHEKRCHSGVCEHLFMALCENSCPMHMNIPGYLQLLKEDKIEEAFELTLRDNPIPGTIGRICHFHCQMRCRREMVDEPVSQGEIHRYLADTMYKLGKESVIYNKLIKEKLSPTGKKIAIVGAGPAGLTAAFYLVRLGHAVTIYDALPEAGGVLRYGIPQYRLPKPILTKEIEFIKKLGVKFVFNTRLGDKISLKKLEAENDAVYMAIGAWKNMGINIPGSDAKGVYAGVKILEDIAMGKHSKIGKNVAIIGAGNVAIDAARSIWRLGSKVTVVYRREERDMPANKDEIHEAQAEGIHFKYLSAPNEIITDKTGQVKAIKIEKMVCGGIDTSGRRKPVSTGLFEEIPCDTVIVAIGEGVDTDLMNNTGIGISRDKTIVIDPFTYQTTVSKIYAGGDAVTGPSTAAEAMGMAKKAAQAIDFMLTGQHRFNSLFRKFEYKNEVASTPEGGGKNNSIRIDVNERVGNFQEVSQGYSGEQARLEVLRCLRCDVKECSNNGQ
jgi:NADH-quinone oxidoreductase subunit F